VDYLGARQPLSVAFSQTIKVPRLFPLFRWLERLFPPKVMLILVAGSQPGTPITLSATKGAGKDGSGDRANCRPNVVRVVRKVRRRPI
jgi:hypothetical protein